MSKSLTLTTDLRQQQKLTPLQVRFVRMLEMSAPEVEEEVQRALDEMPALEAVESEEHLPASNTEDGLPFTESGNDMQRADFKSADDIPDYLENAPRTPLVTSTRQAFYPSDYFEPIVAAPSESLIDTLSNQLAGIPMTDADRKIAAYIIGSIDDNGYITRTPDAIADDVAINEGIDTTPEAVNRIWQIIRHFEPAGIAATDLRDCLLLQLRRMPRSAETLTAIEMLEKHFDLFSRKHFDRIAQQMGIDLSDVRDAISVITRLNPKPAAPFASSDVDDRSRHITPDFSVEPTPDGQLTLTLLSHIPELRVEATFDNESSIPPGSGARLEEARVFMRNKRDDARNFIRIIQLRRETLFRVMSAIVKLQHDFFLSDNDEDIRPMVLRDIADLTGYNLSVISRAAQGKYVATQRGIYPLKKFFNEKVRDNDDHLTSNRIIAEIRKAIENEDPSSPLSDREITQMLANEGFDIARRTVAKYRENLGFPVARLRKKI
ncbi:MAG: RNA polymerase factor sigma-54 [Muribaculaceae bacterium]|nr:RNA polymerase factor sigma-54 [Muribaculaceae bacterium]